MITAELDTEKLNMEKLSALYDRIYDIADRLIKKHNPCKIHIKDKKLCCMCYPTGGARLCCSGCWDNGGIDHYSFFGCTVKCLKCKTWLCGKAETENKLLYHRLCKLGKFAFDNLPSFYYYQSIEKWLEHMQKKTHNIKRFSLTVEV